MTAKPITSGQKRQYLRFVEDAAEAALAEADPDKDGLQVAIEHGDELQSAIREATTNALRRLAMDRNSFAVWSRFYHDNLGLNADFASLVISAPQSGFDRLIVTPVGLTLNRVLAACHQHFNVYSFTDDLDAAVTVNERDPKSSAYVIRVRDRVEADEELKNLSANDIRTRQLTTLTLLERLVYELKYFSETGKHMDIKNVTLCAGSRYSGGGVPGVHWGDDELCVHWCPPDAAGDRLRARAAV